MFKDEDKKIEESLEEMSNFHPKEKEEIWNSIEKELFADEKKKEIKKTKPIKRKLTILVAAAAVVFLSFGSQSETGSALVDKVKSMFEPEKEIIQSIEGMDEGTNLTLNAGKEAEYVIYIDEERYVMEETEAGDVITPKEPLEERYPEVSMTITQRKDQPANEALAEIKDEILADYPNVILDEKTNEPLPGHMFLAKKDGHDWDNELTKVYVLDNGSGGSFIIQQKYFSIAEEGHGARFDTMLKEFHIVED
ncbi:hypothetical protein [Robertmurraya massiliosenegalensis]|uniref:hypothetical protein n=1 Tax=Robertmurraya massiliosenegalensis TaxID=1287657 RepID=UPI00031CA895|nr:hypothetical protein [Robertmurraya massiliosenegalensis]